MYHIWKMMVILTKVSFTDSPLDHREFNSCSEKEEEWKKPVEAKYSLPWDCIQELLQPSAIEYHTCRKHNRMSQLLGMNGKKVKLSGQSAGLPIMLLLRDLHHFRKSPQFAGVFRKKH